MKIESQFVLLLFSVDANLLFSLLGNIFQNSRNVTALHEELLEINLSLTAYIGESETRLKALRLSLANSADSSHKVVDILSDKCKFTLYVLCVPYIF